MNVPVSQIAEEIVNIAVPQIVEEIAEVSKSSRESKCFLGELV